jgi:hypothetical protein
MTPRERVAAAFNFEETDFVPYDLLIESEVEERLKSRLRCKVVWPDSGRAMSAK